MQIGQRIRQVRLARGLSQGDLENRTGLLRCYLSRVENGHTEPSLQTLARLAAALEMPLVGFFEEPGPGTAGATAANPAAAAFLDEMRRCAATLTDADRQQVLELARKMAESKAAAAGA